MNPKLQDRISIWLVLVPVLSLQHVVKASCYHADHHDIAIYVMVNKHTYKYMLGEYALIYLYTCFSIKLVYVSSMRT